MSDSLWLHRLQCSRFPSFAVSQSLHKLVSIESVLPFNHLLILCCLSSSCPQSFPASENPCRTLKLSIALYIWLYVHLYLSSECFCYDPSLSNFGISLFFNLFKITSFWRIFLYLAGGILNRFSKDIAVLDDLLPLTIFDFIQVCKNKY